MPVTPTYPGVYIEEVPSGVRTITGVATAITAFVGRARRGPVNEPVRIQSFSEFERTFGGLWQPSTMSYALSHYFTNGGGDAVVVRVDNGGARATIELATGGDPLSLRAASVGAWGNRLRATVNHLTRDADLPLGDRDPNLFNLVVDELQPASTEVARTETFQNVSVDPDSPRFVERVLAQESSLVRVSGAVPAVRPDEGTTASDDGGSDGDPITEAQVTGPGLEGNKQGLWSLENADLFNLLCIPPLTRDTDITDGIRTAALAYCKLRRAMFLVDPPSDWTTPAAAATGVDALGMRDPNAAVYFPRIRLPDPLQEGRLASFVPSGAVAGIMARTDAQRGVWKAPAGQEATLAGVRELTYRLTDGENGILNPLGVNCLRTFPVVGHVVWGARTLAGADRLASEWKYVPVRRFTLFLEESLYRGTQWVVFEPNDEPLWAQIRLNVGAFMHNLFRQGAFQGRTPREAYLVKCDRETTTQNDINNGIVNIVVGFAPLRPAEFVIIRIQQLAGQIET